MPDSYGNKREAYQFDLIYNRMKATEIHSEPFVVNQNKRLLKHEYPFMDDENQKFVYGFLCMNDPYEATKDEKLRTKWIEEAKLLYGEFKPAGP